MPVSRLTSKYQATIPREVREALGVTAGDRIEYVVTARRVTLRKFADPEFGDLEADDAAFAPEWLSKADVEAWSDL